MLEEGRKLPETRLLISARWGARAPSSFHFPLRPWLMQKVPWNFAFPGFVLELMSAPPPKPPVAAVDRCRGRRGRRGDGGPAGTLDLGKPGLLQAVATTPARTGASLGRRDPPRAVLTGEGVAGAVCLLHSPKQVGAPKRIANTSPKLTYFLFLFFLYESCGECSSIAKCTVACKAPFSL